MDILQMLNELRTQRELVEEVIMAAERLARGSGKRRGRPPKWMTEIKRKPVGRVGRPPKAEVAGL